MDYGQKVIDHYARHWGEPVQVARLLEGRIQTLPEGFRVAVFQPSPGERIFATCCMSLAEEDYRLELHIRASGIPSSEKELVVLLHAVASYHRADGQLGLHHTVNFGQPWQPGSACTHGFISLPYLDGPELEWLEKPEVRFLWLIPVTPAEVKFKKTQGVEALEERFEESQFNYLNPSRPSVV